VGSERSIQTLEEKVFWAVRNEGRNCRLESTNQSSASNPEMKSRPVNEVKGDKGLVSGIDEVDNDGELSCLLLLPGPSGKLNRRV
jgi:hypothetical protein